jgi:hypothetical protein
MAWKLKRSKSADDATELDPSAASEGAVTEEATNESLVSASSELEDEADILEHNRTVMLLKSDELITSLSQDVASDEAAIDLDAEPTTAAQKKEWELDAFAPYQPQTSAFGVSDDDAASSLHSSVPLGHIVVKMGQFSATYEVSKAEFTIGRPDPQVDVQPDISVEWDDAVSRNHARIVHRETGDFVEDTGSTNGTFLNGRQLSIGVAEQLKNGDIVEIGEKTQITYTI